LGFSWFGMDDQHHPLEPTEFHYGLFSTDFSSVDLLCLLHIMALVFDPK
jgi:hypothetical protein